MFKHFLIVTSKHDPAGVNITTQLSQFGDFSFYLIEDDILHTEHLSLEKINRYDFIVFASQHVSKEHTKTLSVHAPGNFTTTMLGGEDGKVCPSSALFQKFLFEKLSQNKEQYNLDAYTLTLEATHHGPLISKPCLFLEIGSTVEEWKDRRAGFVVARALFEAMRDFKENQYHEVAVGLGGPHYCPTFTKLQLSSNVAFSHIISQYAAPITEEKVLEAINKTHEEVDFVVLDWKGLGKSEDRQRVIDILEIQYIQWKKSGEISRS